VAQGGPSFLVEFLHTHLSGAACSSIISIFFYELRLPTRLAPDTACRVCGGRHAPVLQRRACSAEQWNAGRTEEGGRWETQWPARSPLCTTSLLHCYRFDLPQPIRAPPPPNQPSQASNRASQPSNRASQPLNRPPPPSIRGLLPPD
jgi:hypothetical protein